MFTKLEINNLKMNMKYFELRNKPIYTLDRNFSLLQSHIVYFTNKEIVKNISNKSSHVFIMAINLHYKISQLDLPKFARFMK